MEWSFPSSRSERSNPLRPKWNGSFHSGQNGMNYFIQTRREWALLIRPQLNDPFHSGRNEMSISWTQIRNMPPGSLNSPNWLIFLYGSKDNGQTWIYGLVWSQSNFGSQKNFLGHIFLFLLGFLLGESRRGNEEIIYKCPYNDQKQYIYINKTWVFSVKLP